MRPGPSRAGQVSRGLSAAAALLLLVGGYVHWCLYRNGYRYIPKIGVSFLLQIGASAVLAVALFIPGGRLGGRRRGIAIPQVVRLAGIGLGLGDLVALGIAHTSGGLLGFHEMGLRPAPQTLIVIVAESVAAVLLGAAILGARQATPTVGEEAGRARSSLRSSLPRAGRQPADR